MFDFFSYWTRLMATGASMAETSRRAFETARTANEVIAARTKIIGTAMQSPMTGDYRELGRMVPEKVEAFSRTGSATVAAWWTAHSAWMDHMQHLHAAVLRGRPPTSVELGRLGDRTASWMLGSIEATAQLVSDTLKPVHSKATSNAKHLQRKVSPKK